MPHPSLGDIARMNIIALWAADIGLRFDLMSGLL